MNTKRKLLIVLPIVALILFSGFATTIKPATAKTITIKWVKKYHILNGFTDPGPWSWAYREFIVGQNVEKIIVKSYTLMGSNWDLSLFYEPGTRYELRTGGWLPWWHRVDRNIPGSSYWPNPNSGETITVMNAEIKPGVYGVAITNWSSWSDWYLVDLELHYSVTYVLPNS